MTDRRRPVGAAADRAALYARLPLTAADRWWFELARAAGGPVLELGAGAGRLTTALAAADIEVVAVERDPDMLAALRGALGGRGRVVAADVTALPDLGRFGLVALPASLLNELPTPGERAAALAGAARACRADGVVAVQLLGPWWLASLPDRSVGELDPADGAGPVEVVVDADRMDAWTGRRHATVTYRFPDGASLVDHLDAAVVTPLELTAALQAAGLAVAEVWGGEPGTPPTADDPAWHVLARPA